MGLADREYQRKPQRGGGMMDRLTPAVKKILLINIGLFVIDYLFLGVSNNDPNRLPPIADWGAFRISTSIYRFHIWEFFTFQFFHGGLMHVLFNSIALYFFGPWMERYLGLKKFLIFYLLCGAAGAGFYTLLYFSGIIQSHSTTPLIGASAGIYGILIGVAMIAPNLRVQLLFPPIELTMRQLAIALVAIATVVILFNLSNSGGEAGHLGGAILGYFLMRYPQLLGGNPEVSIHRPRAFRRGWKSKLSPRTRIHTGQDSEVDLILDKVSREGFQSLTDDERATLQRAAERQNGDG